MLLFNNILQKWPGGRAPVERSCLQWEVHRLESSFPHETGSVHYPNDIFCSTRSACAKQAIVFGPRTH